MSQEEEGQRIWEEYQDAAKRIPQIMYIYETRTVDRLSQTSEGRASLEAWIEAMRDFIRLWEQLDAVIARMKAGGESVPFAWRYHTRAPGVRSAMEDRKVTVDRVASRYLTLVGGLSTGYAARMGAAPVSPPAPSYTSPSAQPRSAAGNIPPRSALSAAQRFCRACGSGNPLDAAFCGRCGNPLGPPE